ncbi:MAG: ATP-dependent zinc metalloprotease FtsH [Alphaproteobacteria bacterium]|nr:ATP-dependent zinc metalloprotease FtsH [Alphaproteobacteria bacterium]MBR3661694.1 ATP-dependent zinc metalloprotease FtsH [Alphaproteobacteria bacterium]
MKFGKNIIIWLVAFIVLSVIMSMMEESRFSKEFQGLAFSEFMNEVENNRVASVSISGSEIVGETKDGRKFATYAPQSPSMVDTLLAKNVKVDARPEANSENSFMAVLLSWLPMIVLIGIWIFFLRQASSGNNKAMSFGKSRARLIENTKKVTFADVAGADESKQELEEIIDFLKDPQKFQRLGGKIPKGVLMVGPPGTGKTLLAKAVAGEANVPFFSISGSDFVEMFVGVGASRVRDMFAQAKKNAPCLLFIDEIDAVGRHRGAGLGGGNDEREQTLNQLLVEMDGFDANENVILIAATNRPDVLDPALLRPGRFDRQVTVSNPDVKGREAILKVHVRKVPLAKDVDLSVVARGTPGFSGADLANLVNEAALLAARRNKRKVTAEDFDNAKDKVLMGNERKSMAMDEQEKKLTAYHEAGHAICSLHVAETDPIHKATIIPRGRALGMVQQLPEKDQYSYTRAKMLSRLVICMGGRVSEELKFGYDKVTSGASSDIAAATNLARSMVTEWGMSDLLGPVLYAENSSEVFLGRAVTQNKNMSEDTARLVDAEIKRLVTEAHDEAERILKKYDKDLETLAQALMEYETLTGDEIKDILSGKEINRAEQTPVPPEKQTKVSVPEV